MNLAGYIRVSTEGQVDAFGKEVQRESILRWAKLNSHVITHFFEEDGVSGKADGGSRPALSRALEEADVQGYDGIVVLDATRIARRSVVQETLLSLIWGSGLKVFSTMAGELAEDEDDPTKILIRQILGVIAEFDHRTTVRRLHAARRIKSAAGGFVGGTPAFGVRVEGHGKFAEFVTDEVESSVVSEILSMHQEGRSLRHIAAALNKGGHKTKKGRLWGPEQVVRVIRRNG